MLIAAAFFPYFDPHSPTGALDDGAWTKRILGGLWSEPHVEHRFVFEICGLVAGWIPFWRPNNLTNGQSHGMVSVHSQKVYQTTMGEAHLSIISILGFVGFSHGSFLGESRVSTSGG